MNFRQSFSLAIKSLATSKMRAFLTMLGIIIGVGAVIILVSVVNGYKQSMVNQFESLGTNLITVSINSRGSNREVSVDQMYEFAEENSDKITYISPTVSIQAYPKIGTEDLSSTMTGVSEEYDKLKGLDITSGRFLQYMDIKQRSKNCVVGSYISKEFFDGNALGNIIKINGINFTIVGVLDETADSTESSTDDCIYVPYSIARTLSRSGRITQYTVFAADNEDMDGTIELIENFLYGIFSSEDAYRVSSVSQVLDMLDELTGQLTLILVAIAGISLIVGGIGIMNIMIVSVTERTREIGIRKSIGAKRRDIMSQFVVEAATTSAVGGVVGIIFGILVSLLVCHLLDVPKVISAGSVVIAFSVSALIGIVFGYYPASKAAKLNPIDALRYD